MARKKKTDELKKENNIKINIYDKTYPISELIKIADKKKKTYEEIEITKRFKLLIKNYLEGIMCAALTDSYLKVHTLSGLEKKLQDVNTYKTIETRCHNKDNIRFDKETVDTIVQIVKKYDIYN